MSNFEEILRLPEQELFEKTEVVSNKLIQELKNMVGFEENQWTQQQKANGIKVDYSKFWHQLSRHRLVMDAFYWLRKFGFLNLRIQNFHPTWNGAQSNFNKKPSNQIDVVAGLREIQRNGFSSFPFLVM